MSKSLPIHTLLSEEVKAVLEEVVKQKQPALAYFKILKLIELLQNKHKDIKGVYDKLKQQDPDKDPMQDEEFKKLLAEPLEFEELPEILFSNVELSHAQANLARHLLA
jgi:hypothetical protein